MTDQIWHQQPSGNHGGKIARHLFLIMHYTASDSADGAISWLRTPASRASAHFVIDQAGTLTQLVPCDTVAWHAGASQWGTEKGLNACSLGIELVNPGPLAQIRPSVYGTTKRMYLEWEVLHANGKVWAKYPDAQIEASIHLARKLLTWWPDMTILGHSDIAPGRKFDPGPAFPMADFVAKATATA